MAWGMNGTPHTLSSTSDNLEITDASAKKFNFCLAHTLATTFNNSHSIAFNGNSNTVYASRSSVNGVADGTLTSDTEIEAVTSLIGYEGLTIYYTMSISGEEKLIIGFTSYFNASGAAYSPLRSEFVGKFVPSPDADITQFDLDNDGSHTFQAGSNLTAIGTD